MPIFAHTVNFNEYFQKVGLCSKRFSICNGFSRISQGFGHHLDARTAAFEGDVARLGHRRGGPIGKQADKYLQLLERAKQ